MTDTSPNALFGVDTLDNAFALEALRERRDDLQRQLHKIYAGAPFTDGAAYGKAQDGIKNREDLTFSEKELDLMLPHTLRRANRQS